MLWIDSIALSSSDHPSSIQNHWWIRSVFLLSPQLEKNFQTTTKSFVDKRRPRQNGVPDWHVGDKLSFQVSWAFWINSIALSSSDHPSSIQNHWSIRSGFPLSPQRHVFQGCISRSAVKSSIVMESSLPDLFPQEFCSTASMWDFGEEQVLIPIYVSEIFWQKQPDKLLVKDVPPFITLIWLHALVLHDEHNDVCKYGWVFGWILIGSDYQQNNMG